MVVILMAVGTIFLIAGFAGYLWYISQILSDMEDC